MAMDVFCPIESAAGTVVTFRGRMSGEDFRVRLEPGRAAMMLVTKDGCVHASYNYLKED